MMKKKTSLLKNKKKKQTFRSKFEESIANDLDNQKVEYVYESEKLQYTVERNYLPDFKLPSGIFIEAKGWFKSADQRKHRIIKKQHPNIDIRFVFQNPNVINKNRALPTAHKIRTEGIHLVLVQFPMGRVFA